MDTLPRDIKVGIVLFPGAFPLDFIGPLDIFNTLRPNQPLAKETNLTITPTLISETIGKVEMTGGWEIVSQLSFKEATQTEWDVVLVPGGSGARPWNETNRSAQDFLKQVGERVKILMTVCTGSWLVAHTGLLNGYKATTNKSAYKSAVEYTADKGVEWIPKSRWVVDRHVWTASGVTAGMDMTSAFLRDFLAVHLTPEEANTFGDKLLGVLEVIENEQSDDPWAGYYGLK